MKNLLIILLFLCSLASFAIPAKRVVRTVKLTDGTTVNVVMNGDEIYHFLTTTDGIPVIEESEGIYRLAPEIKDSITNEWKERSRIRNTHRFAKARKTQEQNRLHKTFGYPTNYTGKKKGIVILVNFADKQFKTTSTRECFVNQFNQVGYNQNGHIGSVHDYFLDASYGKFDLEFDIFGPVTVSNKYSYYGENNSNGDDKRPAVMCIEACKLADKENTINWSDYDWDNDGSVDQVYFVYAGYGEHAGASANTIWPHESELSSEAELGDGTGSITLGGVKIDTYAVSCELSGTSGSTIDGIGTACHEFSHCLGIPDFYDTSYSGGFGMNAWDVMDMGAYGGNPGGSAPCAYSAYERWFAGWLEFTELNEPCFVKDMPALSDSPTAYIIYNDNNKDEYFILENRQNKGYFTYVDEIKDAHGMLVTHVDYDEEAWVSDEPNNEAKHQRMSIIPAGNNYGTYYSSYGAYYPTDAELRTMPFPGTKKVTELTNESHASKNGKLFNMNTDGSYYMNKPITEITESNGLISFTFMGGVHVDSPTIAEASEVGNGSFTANWTAVEGADSYTIELSPVSADGEIILTEDMSKMANLLIDGTTDIGSKLDDYMSNKGWTGSVVYQAPKGLKLGSSKKTGYITSPVLNATSGQLTVCIDAESYGSDNSTLTVKVIEGNDAVPTSNSPSPVTLTLDAEQKQYVAKFDYVEATDKIAFYTPSVKKRSYIYGITVYDGDVNPEAKQRKAVAASQTIEGIKTNSYTFTDLSEDSYKYRVKAIIGQASSQWSDYVTVEGIKNASTSITATSVSSTDEAIEYFTLNGTRIAAPTQRGIYLVKKAGKVQKMLIDR